mgnify:CR=1 FL=1
MRAIVPVGVVVPVLLHAAKKYADTASVNGFISPTVREFFWFFVCCVCLTRNTRRRRERNAAGGRGRRGFGAGSRGAARVVMVENSPKACAALETNAQLLSAGEGLQIVRADAVKFASSLRSIEERFGVVFLDALYK